jgi:hypothetical protein
MRLLALFVYATAAALARGNSAGVTPDASDLGIAVLEQIKRCRLETVATQCLTKLDLSLLRNVSVTEIARHLGPPDACVDMDPTAPARPPRSACGPGERWLWQVGFDPTPLSPERQDDLLGFLCTVDPAGRCAAMGLFRH